MAARPFDLSVSGHVLAGIAAVLAIVAILAKPSKVRRERSSSILMWIFFFSAGRYTDVQSQQLDRHLVGRAKV